MAQEIPRWLGPLLTSFLLIVIVFFVCWYYCYWKPKKEKEKREKHSKQTHAGSCKSRFVPGGKRSTNGGHKQPLGGSLSYKYDTESNYGGYMITTGYSSGLMGVNYGSYCMDYCPITVDTNPNCVVDYSERPVFKCYNANNSHKGWAAGTRTVPGSRCKKMERVCAASQVKKCMKGECAKSPSLPAIMEGESLTSLCEEEAETKLLMSEKEDSFNTCECVNTKVDVAMETVEEPCTCECVDTAGVTMETVDEYCCTCECVDTAGVTMETVDEVSCEKKEEPSEPSEQ